MNMVTGISTSPSSVSCCCIGGALFQLRESGGGIVQRRSQDVQHYDCVHVH